MKYFLIALALFATAAFAYKEIDTLRLTEPLLMKEQSSSPTATANHGKVYVKALDNDLYFTDANGVETNVLMGGVGGSELSDLSDVATSGEATGDYLQYNGSGWINTPFPISGLDSLNDVALATLATDDYLKYDGAGWVNSPFPTPVVTLDGLTDVTLTTPATDDVLKYDGLGWINSPAPAGVTDLASLSDVTLTSTATGDYLKYDGTDWVNIAESNIPEPLTCAAGQLIEFNGTDYICASMTSSQGQGLVYYFQTTPSSDIVGYDILDGPEIGTEVEESATVTAATSPALIDSYATEEALGRTSITAGVWEFTFFASSSSVVGDNKILVRVYARTATSAENLLFETTSGDISSTSIAPLNWDTVQGEFTINATDRLVVKVYGTTNQVSSRTITFTHNGTENNSHFHTPLIYLHNELGGLQGGLEGQRNHLDDAQLATATRPATASQDGYLTSTDWSTFNSAGNPLTATLASTNLAGTATTPLSATSTIGDAIANRYSFPKTMYFKDVRSSGTACGASTSGSFLQRTINVLNEDGSDTNATSVPFMSLDTGTSSITITSNGEYYFDVASVFYTTENVRMQIFNVSDNAAVCTGLSNYIYGNASGGGISTVKCKVSVTSAPKVFNVKYRSYASVSTFGIGLASTFGVNEVCMDGTITRLK